MLDLLEIELVRVRKMAECADDGFLLYLIDMAVIEANRLARSQEAANSASGSVGTRTVAELGMSVRV